MPMRMSAPIRVTERPAPAMPAAPSMAMSLPPSTARTTTAAMHIPRAIP
jgi:hypothetical protein